jgi:hypothetical protein
LTVEEQEDAMRHWISRIVARTWDAIQDIGAVMRMNGEVTHRQLRRHFG